MDIGVDLDGVLADLTTGTIAYAQLHRPELCLSQWHFDTYAFYNRVGISRTEMYALIDGAWLDRLVPPMPGAIHSSLRKLMKLGNVHIVTSRSRRSHGVVVEWLSEHDFPYDSLVFWHSPRSKFTLPINVLIDDNPNLVPLVPLTSELFLVDAPYNQGHCPSGVTRVASLDDAVTRLEARA